MTAKKKVKAVKTQAALAKGLAALGVKITQQGISKRIRSGDIAKVGPWDVAAIAELLNLKRKEEAAEKELTVLQLAKLENIRSQTHLRELELDHRRKTRDEERDQREAATYGVVRNELVNLSESGVVAAVRQAATEHEGKTILQGRIFEILSRLSGFEGEGKETK